ncbi:MAG: hypothetical protein K2X82_04265 [Gemmataceae bacterium]|nr:hypothetical protein [Gemmataceae bacterium]
MLTALLLAGGVCVQGQVGPRPGDPPADAVLVRHLPPKLPSVPSVFEVSRDEVAVVKNKLVDEVDPPRLFPRHGLVRLHRIRWECVVHYRETVTVAVPTPVWGVLPVRMSKARTETIYYDADRLER